MVEGKNVKKFWKKSKRDVRNDKVCDHSEILLPY